MEKMVLTLFVVSKEAEALFPIFPYHRAYRTPSKKYCGEPACYWVNNKYEPRTTIKGQMLVDFIVVTLGAPT